MKALTAKQAEFILEYEANGRNATNAYMRTHPNCTSRSSAAVEGMRTLRKPHVAHALAGLRKNRVQRLSMQADEAAMLTGMRARANLAHAFGTDGKLLPFTEWPLELQVALKSIKADGSVTLLDQQQATRTVLEMAGKLKQTVDINMFDHVGYLAAKQRAKDAETKERDNGHENRNDLPLQGVSRGRGRAR